jgi:hypothetical protein
LTLIPEERGTPGRSACASSNLVQETTKHANNTKRHPMGRGCVPHQPQLISTTADER